MSRTIELLSQKWTISCFSQDYLDAYIKHRFNSSAQCMKRWQLKMLEIDIQNQCNDRKQLSQYLWPQLLHQRHIRSFSSKWKLFSNSKHQIFIIKRFLSISDRQTQNILLYVVVTFSVQGQKIHVTQGQTSITSFGTLCYGWVAPR